LDSDVRIASLETYLRTDRLRVPLKFGNSILEEVPILLVKVTVENAKGATAEGWGAMPLSDAWAFPDPGVKRDRKLKAMELIGKETCHMMAGKYRTKYSHPIDMMLASKNEMMRISKKVRTELRLETPVPTLAVLVSTSPLDAALHDAFGRANRICSYDGYGPDYMARDLSYYLGKGFEGTYISDFLRTKKTKRLAVFHLVGGVDKLRGEEVDSGDPMDGLPVALEDWVDREGVFCLKVKLTGVNIDWDVERTKSVAEVASEVLRRKGRRKIYLSVDSNELNPSPDATLEYLRKLRRASRTAYDSLLYLEQPTDRDLRRHMFSMKAVSKLKPVLADEGVTDLDDLELAMRTGWSGLAVKTCKWHSSSLLYIAYMERRGIPYSVQDLTCPGIALVHSASLAARSRPIKGFEYNARQYVPFGWDAVREKHTTLFNVKDGMVETDSLQPTGLGYSHERIVPRS